MSTPVSHRIESLLVGYRADAEIQKFELLELVICDRLGDLLVVG